MTAKPRPEELLIAIHKHCLQCSGGNRKEVQSCKLKWCDLYPYRQEQTRPREKPAEGQMTVFNLIGN